MTKKISRGAVALFLAAVGVSGGAQAAEGKAPRVVSDKMVSGFAFPESVGCDAKGLTAYVPDLVQSQLRIVRLAQ